MPMGTCRVTGQSSSIRGARGRYNPCRPDRPQTSPPDSALIPIRGALRSAAQAAVLLLASCADRPPPPPEFGAERAWSHVVRQMSFGPRYGGGKGHDRQLAWMLDELRFRADTVITQEFTALGENAKPLKLTNVVARFRPEAKDRVLLVANWDTRRRADASPEPLDRRLPVPGANLNASGVAVLMEVAELIRRQPPAVGVDLLLADGDDYSAVLRMAGTRHFLESIPGYRPRYAVVLHAVGDVDARFALDTSTASPSGEPARRMWKAARRLRADSVFLAGRPAEVRTPSGRRMADYPVEHQGPLLAAAGIPTIAIADPEYGPLNRRWHTTDDIPAYLSKETLARVGRTVVAALWAELADPEE